jgi:HEAT repeat protein
MGTPFSTRSGAVVFLLLLNSLCAGGDADSLLKDLAAGRPKATRLAAMRKLSEKSSVRALPALRLCINESDAEIRDHALNSLAQICFLAKQGCPLELVQRLNDPDKNVRDCASSNLTLFEQLPKEALPFILKGIESNDPYVRSAVSMALSSFGTKNASVLAALQKATADRNLLVRNNAQISLWKITGNLEPLVRFRLEVISTIASDGIDNQSKPRPPRNNEQTVLLASRIQLEKFGREHLKDLAAILRKFLLDQSESAVIRGASARAFRVITARNPEFLEPIKALQIDKDLRKLLDDPVASVRLESQAALRVIGNLLESPQKAVRKVLADQVRDWNEGDLVGFMVGYWNSPDLTFYADGKKTRGWKATLDHHRKKYQGDAKEMGKLAFSDVEIDVLAPDSALVRGRWLLTLSKGRASGLFTAIFRRTASEWRIIHGHTSSE